MTPATKMPHLRFNNPKTPSPKTGLSTINKISKGEIPSITPRGMGLSGLGVKMKEGGTMSDPFKSGKKAHPVQKLAGGGLPVKAAKPNKGAKKKLGPRGPRGPNLKPSIGGLGAIGGLGGAGPSPLEAAALSPPGPQATGTPAAPVGPPPSGPLAGMNKGGVKTLSKVSKVSDKPTIKSVKDPKVAFPKSKKDSGTEMKKGGMRQRG